MYFLNISFQIGFRILLCYLYNYKKLDAPPAAQRDHCSHQAGAWRIIGLVHVQHVQEGSGVRLPGDTSPELHCFTPRPGSNFWAATHTIQMFLQRLACAACDTTIFKPH